jgi:hypothetical protein
MKRRSERRKISPLGTKNAHLTCRYFSRISQFAADLATSGHGICLASTHPVVTKRSSMKINRIVALTALTVALVSPIRAQTDSGSIGGTRTQELVDQLKDVIRRAEEQRGSNPAVIKQLRDLVRRYDWPWQKSLLYDDFRDGDFTYNPRWIVNEGEFWVARGGGLRSNFDPAAYRTRRTSDRSSGNSALDVLGEILLGGRERDITPTQANWKSEGEIFTRVGISNAFAAKVQLNLRNYAERNTRLEFGLFQGDDRSSGYRLAYDSGETPALSLLRFGPNRSAVIETVNRGIGLEDGNPHTIEWRRGNSAEMVVLLDEKEVIRTVDRANNDPFDGFNIVNKGGEFEIRQVSVFGTQQ